MRIVAAGIFSRFDVIEVQGQEIDFRQYITMQFHTGHWRVVLKPRENPIELLTDGRPEMSEKRE